LVNISRLLQGAYKLLEDMGAISLQHWFTLYSAMWQ